MNFLVYSLAVLAWSACLIRAQSNTTAEEECRKIHHKNVEKTSAKFLNNGCRVECTINGLVYSDNIREGELCVKGSDDYCCKDGCCVSSTGQINVHLISASLNEPMDAYALACLQNNSNAVQLPLKDRSHCINCTTTYVANTIFPKWDKICDEFSKYLFIQDSRVILEAWDRRTSSSIKFLGGTTVTIKQLIQNGDNGRTIHLGLINGTQPGQINVRITWTPEN